MTRNGGDFSWSRPDPADLKRAGWSFVVRYVSDTPGNPGKRMHRPEAVALSAAGLDVVSVFQTSKGFMAGGAAGGRREAPIAHRQAIEAGMPASRPIYFACDFDAQPDQMAAVLAFLDAARSVLGPNRVGVYGSYSVIARAQGHWATQHPGERLFCWQTRSWSAGRWADVDLRQHTHDITVAGAQVDLDSAHSDDFGQWRRGCAP